MSGAPDSDREKPRTSKVWPRLSDTLPHRAKGPSVCGNCGVSGVNKVLRIWQEHDESDHPEPRWIVLCDACGDGVVDPHVRLYARLDRNSPAPGVMELCFDCPARDGWKCRLSKATGGPGVLVTAAKPTTMHVDGRKNGKRFGIWMKYYSTPPSACSGHPTKNETKTKP